MSTFDIDGIEEKYTRSMTMNGHPGLTEEDIRTLVFAIRNYRKMSVRFADIIAGTASWLVSLKSTSKSERARQVSICKSTSEMLRYECGGDGRMQDRAWVVQRLDEVVKDAT